MIAIIDYDAGNIKSVEKAIQYLGEEALVTRDRDEILRADGVILPGVGAFGDAMGKLRDYGLEEVIHECVDGGKPFLGICLGLQLLFERSEESPGVKGLGVLEGEIVRLPSESGLKIPHIGWNNLKFPHHGRLFEGVAEDSYVYFVHSYAAFGCEEYVTAQADYSIPLTASVQKENVFGTQFHPEKSGETGLVLLKNFCSM